ncbi:WxL domain-containing protein [Levilactobacillus huananensis]|uniref:WxL domain-containing protein n=1 Tax=Levilactobacillus huananensis TaxID=2486019 RepID=UPI000F7AE7C8|nr:WxL domain-containing protein [Levilactobacillus huananensis]
MKKTVSSILLASALLLGSIAPVVANAATTPTSGTTTATAKFTAPDPVTKPVDPNNPSNPATGTQTGNGATTGDGNLTFLYVTNNLDFGSSKSVTSGSQDVKGQTTIAPETFTTDGTPTSDFVTEISDTRGSNAGWTVQLTSTKMVDTSNSDVNTNYLKGATIDFNGGDGATKINNSAKATDGIAANSVKVSTISGSTQTIYGAVANSGAGQTTFQLDPSNIQLSSVGATTNTGTYTGTLNWTLSETPAVAPQV